MIALLFTFCFRACAFPFRNLTGCIPIRFEVVQAVAVYAFRPYPVCKGEPAYLGLAETEQAHDVEAGIPMLREVVAQPLLFLCHSLVHLRFRKAFCGIGLDAGDGVPHTEVLETPVGLIELLAYLRHCVKVAAYTLFVRKRVPNGLLVV